MMLIFSWAAPLFKSLPRRRESIVGGSVDSRLRVNDSEFSMSSTYINRLLNPETRFPNPSLQFGTATNPLQTAELGITDWRRAG